MPQVIRCALDRETAPAEFDERNRGTYSLRYIVTTTGRMSSREVANQATDEDIGPHPLPKLWDTFKYLDDEDPYSYARHFLIEPVAGFIGEAGSEPKKYHIYHADVQFRPLKPGESPGTFNSDPMSRPAELSWDSEEHTAYYYKDRFGKDIINCMGWQYEDPTEIVETRGVLVVRCNVETLSEVIDHTTKFQMTTNSAPFKVGGELIGRRQALCRTVASERLQNERQKTFYTEIYRIAFKKIGEAVPTWDEDLLERGFAYWKRVDPLNPDSPYVDKNDGSKNFIRVENGRALFDAGATPARLKADGTLLEVGQPGVFTKWECLAQSDFTQMPFNLFEPVP